MALRSNLVTPHAEGERGMLLSNLQRQRDLVMWKVAGLAEGDARGVSSPSGLTIHGLVRHLMDVERSWIRRWFAGEPGVPYLGMDPNHVGGLAELDGSSLDEVVAAYDAESARCDTVVALHVLDDVAVAAGPRTLRWVLHHLVEETARHLGHLDLLCELADGRTGEEPAAQV
jgi:uncharacterized damage-inducible protein DinB